MIWVRTVKGGIMCIVNHIYFIIRTKDISALCTIFFSLFKFRCRWTKGMIVENCGLSRNEMIPAWSPVIKQVIKGRYTMSAIKIQRESVKNCALFHAKACRGRQPLQICFITTFHSLAPNTCYHIQLKEREWENRNFSERMTFHMTFRKTTDVNWMFCRVKRLTNEFLRKKREYLAARSGRLT